MKRVTRNIIIVTLVMIMTIAPAFSVFAKTTFALNYMSSNCKEVQFSIANVDEATEVKVYNHKGKVVKKAEGYSYPSVKKLKKKKAYYARYRQVTYDGEATSGWSKKLGFITFNKFKKKQVGRQMKLYYKLPKIKGVKKYKVEISKKRDKGYRKVKNAKPGKRVYISRCKGKKLKKYVTYYVRITPKIKGCSKNTSYIDSFYFLSRFY